MSQRDVKTQAIKAHISGLIARLENWVKEQKRFMNELEKYGDYISSQDRLSLLLSAQALLYHIEKILKDFESWLSNPMITSLMSVEMLKELEEKLRRITIEFVKLDIEHTGKYTEILKKLESEESIPEILRLYFEHKAVLTGREYGERREMPRVL